MNRHSDEDLISNEYRVRNKKQKGEKIYQSSKLRRKNERLFKL